MPEYLHPGVYIEEIERGPKPIEGVPTSTAAFLGATERGPTWPTLCTSFKDYVRWFGNVFGDDKFMPYAVAGFFENAGKRMYVCRIADDAATTARAAFGANFTVEAAGPGLWGTRVYAQITNSRTMKPGPNNTIVPVGFRLRLAYYSRPPTGNPLDWFNDPRKEPFPSFSEDYDDLVTDEKSPDFYDKRLDKNSALGKLVRGQNAAPGAPPANGFAQLTNAVDGAPIDIADYQGQIAPPNRLEPQGLAALELDPFREVSLVYAPGVGFDVAKAVVTHCENMRFRFAVVDSQKDMPRDFQPRNGVTDTKYAGFYYPWIYISDPLTGAQKIVPPGGHVLGIFARSDAEFGVFKAPANEPVRGALELYKDTDDGTQDVFNPRGINAIREFPGRGIRVWGARTLSSDPLHKYTNVRRFLNFLERSIYESCQWVVFESNNEKLWDRVTDTVKIFLRAQWRTGALMGRVEEQAFSVVCDRTVMTQDDILNGRLVCEIGVAIVRPAEFVIFRIFQNTAEAQR